MMTVYGEIKLIDFGLCIDVSKTNGRAQSMVGSPFWMPPEMIKREQYTYSTTSCSWWCLLRLHNLDVDIWSLAMCLLELANREPPFYKVGSLKAMFTAATVGYAQPFYQPNKWSDIMKDFIGQCLTVNPAQRPSAEQLLSHPFLEKANSKKGMKDILAGIFLNSGLKEYGLL
jgi:p21-activated kinase 1